MKYVREDPSNQNTIDRMKINKEENLIPKDYMVLNCHRYDVLLELDQYHWLIIHKLLRMLKQQREDSTMAKRTMESSSFNENFKEQSQLLSKHND